MKCPTPEARGATERLQGTGMEAKVYAATSTERSVDDLDRIVGARRCELVIVRSCRYAVPKGASIAVLVFEELRGIRRPTWGRILRNRSLCGLRTMLADEYCCVPTRGQPLGNASVRGCES